MSGTLTARGLRASFGAVTVLGGVDLVAGPGDRVGVVAPNGVGKSTLLRVLAGDLTPDEGTVSRSPTTATVVRLTQEPDIRPGESLLDQLARRTGVAAATRELDAATAALAATDGAGPAADRYAAALDAWLALGGDDLAERAATLTAELALPADLGERDATALSGGQQARLALAAVLLARPDILLLDEPTNDLDDAGLARLESHLRGVPGGVVLVSHDREFLDRIIDRVLEIDQFTRRGAEYRGGWQAYLAERAATRRHAEEAYQEYSDKRDRLVESARRQRQWAQSGLRRAATRPDDGDKNIRHARMQGAQNTAAGATRMDRAIERLDRDAPDEPREPWELRLAIGETRRAGDIVAQLRGAVIERGDVRLGPLDLTLGWAERVRLVGPNGSGKTSLVEALLGRLPLAAGERYLGPGVVLGELDQSRRDFATDEPVMEVVRAAAGLSPTEARTLLAKFRLRGDAALRPAASLSPGERTRAGLALLQARGVNCLILDEPTNHLDIEAIEQLEQALATYRGTLLLVTHDRRLADAVHVDRTIDLTA